MTSLLDSRECVNCIHDERCRITPDSFLWCFDRSTPPSFDGYLDYWWSMETNYGTVIWGTIYNDAKGRFGSGVCVRTSPLKSDSVPREGCVVHTMNSKYMLGKQRKF